MLAVEQPLRDHVVGRRHGEAVGRAHGRVHPQPGGAGLGRVGRRRVAHPRLRHQAHLRGGLAQRHRGDQAARARLRRARRLPQVRRIAAT